MSHRFAPPPPPLPRFMDEAFYLGAFITRWKLRAQGIEDKDIGVLTNKFLKEWGKHRANLQIWRWTFGQVYAASDDVRACIDFVDDLVSDWQQVLDGNEPEKPLDESRLLKFQNHQQKLYDIPGDSLEIKY